MKGLAMLLTLAAAAIPALGWTPPAKPDPQQILSEARDDRVAGRFEDALQKHLWFHREALKYEPGLAGVRGSFAISDWAHLGAKYPPAKQALLKLREDASENVTAGRDVRESFLEVTAVDGVVGDWAESYRLFLLIESRDEALARDAYRVAQQALVEVKDFARAAKYLDARSEIRRLHEMHKYTSRRKATVEMPPQMKQQVAEIEERGMNQRIGQVVAVMVLGARPDDARAAATLARELFKHASLEQILAHALEGRLPPPLFSAADRATLQSVMP
jgi:hypothetical protein